MPKGVIYAAIPVFLLTTVAWVIGVSNHTFLASEFWLYVGIFLVPGGLVCGCVWLIVTDRIWARVLGALLGLPCLAIWVLSLLLVYSGFRIH